MNMTTGQSRTLDSWLYMIKVYGFTDSVGCISAQSEHIAQEWFDPWIFLSDMGERPEGLILGKIDASGKFSKTNCFWQTLTEQNFNNKRTVLIGEMTQSQVADETGLTDTTIKRRREGGRNVRDPKYFKRNKLNQDQVREIKRLFGTGMSNVSIARIFDVSHSNIRMIRHGKFWANV